MNRLWLDRAVTALITLLLGASAQGLLSWRELSVLSSEVVGEVATRSATDAEIAARLEAVADQQADLTSLIARIGERLESTRDSLKEHKELRQHSPK